MKFKFPCHPIVSLTLVPKPFPVCSPLSRALVFMADNLYEKVCSLKHNCLWFPVLACCCLFVCWPQDCFPKRAALQVPCGIAISMAAYFLGIFCLQVVQNSWETRAHTELKSAVDLSVGLWFFFLFCSATIVDRVVVWQYTGHSQGGLGHFSHTRFPGWVPGA